MKNKLKISVNSLPLLARKNVFSVEEVIEIVIDFFKPKRELIVINHPGDEQKLSAIPQSLQRDDVTHYLKTCSVDALSELINKIQSDYVISIFLSRTDIDLESQIKIGLLKKNILPLIKRGDVEIQRAFELLKTVPSSNGFTAFDTRSDSTISQMIELCNTSEFYKLRINKIVIRPDFLPAMLFDFLSETISVEGLDVALLRFDFCKHLMSIDAEEAIAFAKKFNFIELWKVVSRNRNLSLERLIECVEKIEPLSFYSPEYWNMVISRRDCPLKFAIEQATLVKHKSCMNTLSGRKDFQNYIFEGKLEEVFPVVINLDSPDFCEWFIEREDITLPIAYWYMEHNTSSKDYIERYVKIHGSKDELIEFAKENHDIKFIQAIAQRDDMDVEAAISFVRTYFRGNTWRMLQNKKGISDYFKNRRMKDIAHLIDDAPGDSIQQMIFRCIGGSSYEILKKAAAIDSNIIWGVIVSRNDFLLKYLVRNSIKKLTSILKNTKNSEVVWMLIFGRHDIDIPYFIKLAKETGALGLCEALEWKLERS